MITVKKNLATTAIIYTTISIYILYILGEIACNIGRTIGYSF